ncbi:hypothetical protein J0S82_006660, partial [Galemys pyrenaicus]
IAQNNDKVKLQKKLNPTLSSKMINLLHWEIVGAWCNNYKFVRESRGHVSLKNLLLLRDGSCNFCLDAVYLLNQNCSHGRKEERNTVTRVKWWQVAERVGFVCTFMLEKPGYLRNKGRVCSFPVSCLQLYTPITGRQHVVPQMPNESTGI